MLLLLHTATVRVDDEPPDLRHCFFSPPQPFIFLGIFIYRQLGFHCYRRAGLVWSWVVVSNPFRMRIACCWVGNIQENAYMYIHTNRSWCLYLLLISTIAPPVILLLLPVANIDPASLRDLLGLVAFAVTPDVGVGRPPLQNSSFLCFNLCNVPSFYLYIFFLLFPYLLHSASGFWHPSL